jgi:hypothetical protein
MLLDHVVEVLDRGVRLPVVLSLGQLPVESLFDVGLSATMSPA